MIYKAQEVVMKKMQEYKIKLEVVEEDIQGEELGEEQEAVLVVVSLDNLKQLCLLNLHRIKWCMDKIW